LTSEVRRGAATGAEKAPPMLPERRRRRSFTLWRPMSLLLLPYLIYDRPNPPLAASRKDSVVFIEMHFRVGKRVIIEKYG